MLSMHSIYRTSILYKLYTPYASTAPGYDTEWHCTDLGDITGKTRRTVPADGCNITNFTTTIYLFLTSSIIMYPQKNRKQT